jgi:FkbM family methyltransferase
VRHAKDRSGSWLVAPCAALGGKCGEIEINISANSVSSSVLDIRQTHIKAAPQSQYIGKQIVHMERLDELAAQYIQPAAELFIKVDTQGYELEVLKGATALWPNIVALQLELSLVPLYDQAPTFLDMIAFMTSNGFELFGLVPGFRDQSSGRMLQVDGFFVRANLGTGKS